MGDYSHGRGVEGSRRPTGRGVPSRAVGQRFCGRAAFFEGI